MGAIGRWSPEDQAEAMRLLRALADPAGPDEAIRARVWAWLKDRPSEPPTAGAVRERDALRAKVSEFAQALTLAERENERLRARLAAAQGEQ